MPTGYTFTSYQAAVVTQIPSLTSDPNFTTVLPDAIDYAELTILRDLDLVSAHGLIPLGSTTPLAQLQALPPGVIVLEQLFLGATNTPVVPASQDYIRAVYAGAAMGPPRHFMVIGGATTPDWSGAMQVLLGPTPDIAYTLTGYGTERPATLSATNPTTFISTVLPDVFWAASMIFWSGYNRNFGAQSDQPQQAVSWKAEYDRLLKSSMVEEARKTFRSQAWVAEAPTMVAGART